MGCRARGREHRRAYLSRGAHVLGGSSDAAGRQDARTRDSAHPAPGPGHAAVHRRPEDTQGKTRATQRPAASDHRLFIAPRPRRLGADRGRRRRGASHGRSHAARWPGWMSLSATCSHHLAGHSPGWRCAGHHCEGRRNGARPVSRSGERGCSVPHRSHHSRRVCAAKPVFRHCPDRAPRTATEGSHRLHRSQTPAGPVFILQRVSRHHLPGAGLAEPPEACPGAEART